MGFEPTYQRLKVSYFTIKLRSLINKNLLIIFLLFHVKKNAIMKKGYKKE